jgi:gliding motility-associated-like protein
MITNIRYRHGAAQRSIVWVIGILLSLSFAPAMGDDLPSASPVMTVQTTDSTYETTSYEGSAPVKVTLDAGVKDLGGYTPIYQWNFYKSGESETPFLIRYDESTEYTFDESGSFTIQLNISFVMGEDTIDYSQESSFTISISTSKLEIPNAFSPNGDGQNDVFKVKEGHQSITSFHGYIFSRWGKKIYDWTDINGGWDGTIGGKDAKDGVYYVIIKAKGADGKVYNLRRDVNLLRGYESSDKGGTDGN